MTSEEDKINILKNQSDGMNFDVFLSHDGTGMSPLEAECLSRCLDARDKYIRSKTTTNEGGVSVKELSMEYRAALCECLIHLQTTEEEGNNFDLLNSILAISYLAEIFLLPVESSSISSYPTNPSGRLDGPPGSLTADTVRYLRLHHIGSLMDNPEIITMCNSDQPEYYKGKLSIPGPYSYPFWNLVLQLVITGELSQAWSLLSYHSACRFAEEEASDTELVEGFAALRSLLMAAPLPGGRGDVYGDDAGLDDYLEEELLEKGEGEGINDMEDSEEHDVEDPGDINTILVDGISQNAYLLWEMFPRHADKLRTLRYRRDLRRCGRSDAIEGSLESPSMPEFFTVNAALSAYRKWQETIRMTAFPSNGDEGVMSVLFERFPASKEILSILLGGSIPQSISNRLSWSELLLLELLYSRPNISPGDIVVRAANAMSKENGDSPLEEVILNIMKGSTCPETMFSVCGGSSGAALPAAMTSLFCNLLIDAGCMSQHQDSTQQQQLEAAVLGRAVAEAEGKQCAVVGKGGVLKDVAEDSINNDEESSYDSCSTDGPFKGMYDDLEGQGGSDYEEHDEGQTIELLDSSADEDENEHQQEEEKDEDLSARITKYTSPEYQAEKKAELKADGNEVEVSNEGEKQQLTLELNRLRSSIKIQSVYRMHLGKQVLKVLRSEFVEQQRLERVVAARIQSTYQALLFRSVIKRRVERTRKRLEGTLTIQQWYRNEKARILAAELTAKELAAARLCASELIQRNVRRRFAYLQLLSLRQKRDELIALREQSATTLCRWGRLCIQKRRLEFENEQRVEYYTRLWWYVEAIATVVQVVLAVVLAFVLLEVFVHKLFEFFYWLWDVGVAAVVALWQKIFRVLAIISLVFLGVPVGLDFMFSFIGRNGAHVAPNDDNVADNAPENNQDEIHNGDPLVLDVAAAVANELNQNEQGVIVVRDEVVDAALALTALAEDSYTPPNR